MPGTFDQLDNGVEMRDHTTIGVADELKLKSRGASANLHGRNQSDIGIKMPSAEPSLNEEQ